MCRPAGTVARDVSAAFADFESSLLGEPYCSFQFVKTPALGLGTPQGITVMIHLLRGTLALLTTLQTCGRRSHDFRYRPRLTSMLGAT
jgi:hypothetical protein